jgi:ketosteroid isomerase-like protein
MASTEIGSHAELPPKSADDVSATHSRWWHALLHADAVALDTLLADNLTFHSPIGTVATKAEFVERVRSGWLEYNSVTADDPLIRLCGDAAIVTGRADIQYRAQGQPRSEGLYYTAVYGWTLPQWRMLAWQSTARADARG